MWINNSDAIFSYERFNKVTNSRYLYRNKPNCGLWLARHIENGQFKSDWHQWCYNADFRIKAMNTIYKLNRHSKIYIINNQADFDDLLTRFPILYSNPLEEEISCIDFESLSAIYDGVYVTENGLAENKDTLM